MPFYCVLVEGTKLCIPGDRDHAPIVGFFATRVVWSATPAQAELKVLKLVRRVWQSGAYASQPSAQQLELAVTETSESGIWHWLSHPRKGHTFFGDE